MYPKLKEGFLQWEVQINPNLKFFRAESIGKGITKYWGEHTDGRYYPMFAIYPKTYTKSQMDEILERYKRCPDCQIGHDNLSFKYEKNNNRSMNSIIEQLSRIPYIGSFIAKNKSFFKNSLLQGGATALRYPIKGFTTELGGRLACAGIGGIPTVILFILDNLGKLNIPEDLKDEIYTALISILMGAAEPVPSDSLGSYKLTDDVQKLKGAISTGQYFGVADALIQNPEKIKAAAQRLANTVQMGNFAQKIANFFGGFNFERARQGWLRLTEGTIGGRGTIPLGGGEKALGKSLGNFRGKSQVADEFGFLDTSKRFREISDFSSGFKSKERFRMAGTGHETRR